MIEGCRLPLSFSQHLGVRRVFLLFFALPSSVLPQDCFLFLTAFTVAQMWRHIKFLFVMFRFPFWESFCCLSPLHALPTQLNRNSFGVFALPLHSPWWEKHQRANLFSFKYRFCIIFLSSSPAKHPHKPSRQNAIFLIGHLRNSGPYINTTGG